MRNVSAQQQPSAGKGHGKQANPFAPGLKTGEASTGSRVIQSNGRFRRTLGNLGLAKLPERPNRVLVKKGEAVSFAELPFVDQFGNSVNPAKPETLKATAEAHHGKRPVKLDSKLTRELALSRNDGAAVILPEFKRRAHEHLDKTNELRSGILTGEVETPGNKSDVLKKKLQEERTKEMKGPDSAWLQEIRSHLQRSSEGDAFRLIAQAKAMAEGAKAGARPAAGHGETPAAIDLSGVKAFAPKKLAVDRSATHVVTSKALLAEDDRLDGLKPRLGGERSSTKQTAQQGETRPVADLRPSLGTRPMKRGGDEVSFQKEMTAPPSFDGPREEKTTGSVSRVDRVNPRPARLHHEDGGQTIRLPKVKAARVSVPLATVSKPESPGSSLLSKLRSEVQPGTSSPRRSRQAGMLRPDDAPLVSDRPRPAGRTAGAEPAKPAPSSVHERTNEAGGESLQPADRPSPVRSSRPGAESVARPVDRAAKPAPSRVQVVDESVSRKPALNAANSPRPAPVVTTANENDARPARPGRPQARPTAPTRPSVASVSETRPDVAGNPLREAAPAKDAATPAPETTKPASVAVSTARPARPRTRPDAAVSPLKTIDGLDHDRPAAPQQRADRTTEPASSPAARPSRVEQPANPSTPVEADGQETAQRVSTMKKAGWNVHAPSSRTTRSSDESTAADRPHPVRRGRPRGSQASPRPAPAVTQSKASDSVAAEHTAPPRFATTAETAATTPRRRSVWTSNVQPAEAKPATAEPSNTPSARPAPAATTEPRLARKHSRREEPVDRARRTESAGDSGDKPEQVARTADTRSAQPATGAAARPTAAPAGQAQQSAEALQNLESLLRTVKSRAKIIKGAGGVMRAEVPLKPEGLGKVLVTVIKKAGQYSVKLTAERADAARAIDRALPAMREALAHAGIPLDKADVEIGAAREQQAPADRQGGQDTRQQDSGNQAGDRSGGRRRAEDSGSGEEGNGRPGDPHGPEHGNEADSPRRRPLRTGTNTVEYTG